MSFSRRGFTLIELLIVIAIIGVVSVAAVALIKNWRVNARDAVRRTDARQLQKALELYLSGSSSMMNCGYVSSCSGGMAPGTCLANALVPYMTHLPNDPLNDEASEYCYQVCTEGSGCTTFFPAPDRYFIRIKLESTGATEDIFIAR